MMHINTNKDIPAWNWSNFQLSWHEPIVQGILNVTPDSFFQQSRILSLANAISSTEKMLIEGATIIDIGAYSTRPNALDISIEEEWKRIAEVLPSLVKQFPNTIFSIDTFRAEIAKRAVEHGAAIVNDISGGNLDEAMFDTLAQLQVPYILMHSRGTPQTMTTLNQYESITQDVISELLTKVSLLQSKGVKHIMLDAGFGFAKNIKQNFQLLKELELFNNVPFPLLVGISRKSMIYKTLEITPDESLNGTTALNTIALLNGAKILRVHDVKEAVQTIKLVQKVFNS